MNMSITANSHVRLAYALNPLKLACDLWRHWGLIQQVTWREIEGRYKGSFLGLFWVFLTPLVMLLVFTFVFGVVLKTRWPQLRDGDSLAEFALVLFVGQLAFQIFGEPMGRAANLIVNVPNFVKKVAFPLQILPVSLIGAALYHASFSLLVAIIGTWWIYGSIPWTALLVPLSLLPIAMLALGCSWFLSSMGVYLRDVGNLAALGLQVLFYASAIFYPLETVPEPFRTCIACNPLTSMVALVRDHLLFGSVGDPIAWLSAFGWGLAALLLGYAWFMVTRRGFADVL